MIVRYEFGFFAPAWLAARPAAGIAGSNPVASSTPSRAENYRAWRADREARIYRAVERAAEGRPLCRICLHDDCAPHDPDQRYANCPLDQPGGGDHA